MATAWLPQTPQDGNRGWPLGDEAQWYGRDGWQVFLAGRIGYRCKAREVTLTFGPNGAMNVEVA